MELLEAVDRSINSVRENERWIDGKLESLVDSSIHRFIRGACKFINHAAFERALQSATESTRTAVISGLLLLLLLLLLLFAVTANGLNI